MPNEPIDGQLNAVERRLLTEAVTGAAKKPEVLVEVGTWLGGGSTLHILRAMEENGTGHLWGIEADQSVYERMLENIRSAVPKASGQFSPLFGFSQDVIPRWLREQGAGVAVDFAFLDGGNSPLEQIKEFRLLDPHIPVGGQLMAHDAKFRKGKWLVPYLSRLDNWEVKLHDVSDEGLLQARKNAAHPSSASLWAARKKLWSLRCNPVEVVAASLPAPICCFCLSLLPRRLSRRLAEGLK